METAVLNYKMVHKHDLQNYLKHLLKNNHNILPNSDQITLNISRSSRILFILIFRNKRYILRTSQISQYFLVTLLIGPTLN